MQRFDFNLNDQLNWRHVAFVLVVAVAVRAGALVAFYDHLGDDPDGYRRIALNLVEYGTYGMREVEPGVVQPSAYRPPLYPLLLAGLVVAGGNSALAIAAVHFILGVATVLLVVALAAWHGLGRSSVVAAMLVACDPILLRHSASVMTETLATFLAVGAMLALVRMSARPSLMNTGLAAAALALASLCRPAFYIYFLPAVVLVSLPPGRWGQRMGRLATFAVVAAALVAPWAVRNMARFGVPILATTHGGYTFYLGNNPDFFRYLRQGAWGAVWHPGPEFYDFSAGIVSPPQQDAWRQSRTDYRRGIEAIRNEPAMFATACLVRVGRLWQLVPHRTVAPETSPARLLRYAVGVWYAVVFLLALAGAWAIGSGLVRAPWLWGVLFCLGFTLVHTFYWSNMRMRAVLVPAVALLAAKGLASVRGRLLFRKTLL